MSATPYIFLTSILSLTFFILLVYLISVIVYPKQPINYLRKQLGLNTNTHLDEDSTAVEQFTYNRTTLNIYYFEKYPATDTLVIDLPGGAFIASSNTFKHYKYIDQPHTVVTVEYPVLPSGSFRRAMEYLEAAFEYLIRKKYNDKKIILSAASAGCYYATKIINNAKFNDKIVKFICMSGYFGYNTIPNIYTYITEVIYLHHSIKNQDSKTVCKPVPSHIETFYTVGANDDLKISTYEFLKQSGEMNKVIEYPNVGHVFYLQYTNDTTKEFYKDMANFIKL